MKNRLFKNEEKISLLGFGTMRLPRIEEDKQNIDVKTAQEMVDYAFSSGINYFDTAYPYHNGESETFIGDALKKYPRDSYNLATKMPLWLIGSKKDAEKYFNEQLKKCQVDYFDFYLAHNVNESFFEIFEKYRVYDFLKEKQKEGKIRYLGFSFHDNPTLLEKVVSKYDWDFAQIQLNYLDWELQDAKRQYEILTEKEIPIIVMEPVRGGALATLSEKAVKIFENENPAASPASWAIRYAATFPNVLTVLSGMSDMRQLKDNVNTMENFKPLTDKDYDTITEAVTAYRESLEIPCTYCRYCMECPSGVHIPKVFAKYNQQIAKGKDADKFYFFMEYKLLGKSRQAHQCTKCGVCVPKCPQGIDIPKELEKVAKFAEKR